MPQAPVLFRYFDKRGALETLSKKTIRLKSPRLFNDPFDVAFPIRPDTSFEQFVVTNMAKLDLTQSPEIRSKLLNEAAESVFENFSENEKTKLEPLRIKYDAALERASSSFRSHLNDFVVLCLTPKPLDLLMWSHYGDQHRGAVLGFNANGKTESIFSLAKSVSYHTSYPKMGPLEVWTSADLVKRRTALGKMLDFALYSKFEEWRYEEEYRVAFPDAKSLEAGFIDLPLRKTDVCEIVLGCRAEPDFVAQIVSVASLNFPGVPIFLTEKSTTAFALNRKQHIS